jgi:hypothetical protein
MPQRAGTNIPKSSILKIEWFTSLFDRKTQKIRENLKDFSQNG